MLLPLECGSNSSRAPGPSALQLNSVKPATHAVHEPRTLQTVPPNGKTGQSRSAALKRLIGSKSLSFLMEAHSALAARIVEEAGFAGIWASGLSISASLGLRDSNEASWTQLLEVLEYMADATTIPILVDGDTGYGNFNNTRRLVRKLEQRGMGGVCIEDKLFPKTNSFVGENQPLASVEEFCGKIRAGCDHRDDPDFQIVARCEALISGHSMEEAWARCSAYEAAGADAILIHSKKRNAAEIARFMEGWEGSCPVVIVPTTYHATPTETFRQLGVSTVIWANYLVRASITAMRETASRILVDESLNEVEGRVASVADIFHLTGNEELEEAQKRYLPAIDVTRAIVLAASRGDELATVTAEVPKCMLDVRGEPLLRRLVRTLRESGVHDVAVVRGWRKEAVSLSDIATVDNDAFATTGEVASLACARDRLAGETLIVYGDILFRRYILDGLLSAEGDVVIVVDQLGVASGHRTIHPRDLVWASHKPSAHYLDDAPSRLLGIGAPFTDGDGATQVGEWIGLLRLSARGADIVGRELDAMTADGSIAHADMSALLARVARHTAIAIHYVAGHWLGVDTLHDLADARNFS